jgi:hypothetical protein
MTVFRINRKYNVNAVCKVTPLMWSNAVIVQWLLDCCCVVVGVAEINATPTREKCIQHTSTSNAGKYRT